MQKGKSFKGIHILFIFTIILILILSSCIDKWEIKEVEATIIDKTFDHSYQEYVPVVTNGVKQYKTKYHPENFEIKLKYDNIVLKKDVPERIYDKYQVDDKIKASLKIGYKDGEIVKRKLVWNIEY